MKPNARLLLVAVLCLTQFISCKKENNSPEPTDEENIDSIVTAKLSSTLGS